MSVRASVAYPLPSPSLGPPRLSASWSLKAGACVGGAAGACVGAAAVAGAAGWAGAAAGWVPSASLSASAGITAGTTNHWLPMPWPVTSPGTSAGMTSRLDRLERRGLVARTADPADRRGILVDLTPRGLELVDTVVAANTREEKELVAGLTPEEVSSLAGLLRTLLSRLEDQGGGPQPPASDRRRDQVPRPGRAP
jgi:MarR family